MLPYVRVDRHDRMHAILARAVGGLAVATAVVHPVDAASLLPARGCGGGGADRARPDRPGRENPGGGAGGGRRYFRPSH